MTLCHIRMMRIFKRSKESVSGQKRLLAFLILSPNREKTSYDGFVLCLQSASTPKKLLRLFIFYSPSVCLDMSQILFVMS